jgi:hypothetical protein
MSAIPPLSGDQGTKRRLDAGNPHKMACSLPPGSPEQPKGGPQGDSPSLDPSSPYLKPLAGLPLEASGACGSMALPLLGAGHLGAPEVAAWLIRACSPQRNRRRLSPQQRRESRLSGIAALGQRTNPLARERAARGAEFVATTEVQVEIG